MWSRRRQLGLVFIAILSFCYSFLIDKAVWGPRVRGNRCPVTIFVFLSRMILKIFLSNIAKILKYLFLLSLYVFLCGSLPSPSLSPIMKPFLRALELWVTPSADRAKPLLPKEAPESVFWKRKTIILPGDRMLYGSSSCPLLSVERMEEGLHRAEFFRLESRGS